MNAKLTIAPAFTRRDLLAAAAMGGRSWPISLPAHAADRFVDSVGVCTHLDSAPYAGRLDIVLSMAAALGVRHFRDELRGGADLARWRVPSARGIRLHLLVSPATNTVDDMLAFIAALGPDAVSAIEGQNEGDSPWFEAQPAAKPDWAQTVSAYQRAIFTALRHRWGPGAVPVVSPSVLDYRPQDMTLLREAAPFCDVVALHAYLQGQQEPETTQDDASIDWYLRRIRDAFKPGAPAMVTETGYATSAHGISPRAASIYLPRLLLHLFGHGIIRSFCYEFLDGGESAADPEQNYGLLHADGTAKPAFDPLRLLLGALTDPGPPHAAGPVALSVEAAPPDLRLMPFRKRDGQIVLAAWRAARSWDPAAKRDLEVAPATLRLLLPMVRGAEVLLLEPGATWRETGGGTRLDLALADRVCLIRPLAARNS